jgi:hypothetical protein
MKRFLFNLVVICSALFLFACQHSEKPGTAFFQNFNLGATVQQMNVAQLQPKTGGGGATTAIGETTEYRRNFELEYLFNEVNNEQFDEFVFLNKLKSEVAEQISDASIRANGTGSSNDGFYFNYSTDENRGSVEVIGARVEGDKYKLWCVVRESAGIKSDK